jgi:hypothetical protein
VFPKEDIPIPAVPNALPSGEKLKIQDWLSAHNVMNLKCLIVHVWRVGIIKAKQLCKFTICKSNQKVRYGLLEAYGLLFVFKGGYL